MAFKGPMTSWIARKFATELSLLILRDSITPSIFIVSSFCFGRLSILFMLYSTSYAGVSLLFIFVSLFVGVIISRRTPYCIVLVSWCYECPTTTVLPYFSILKWMTTKINFQNWGVGFWSLPSKFLSFLSEELKRLCPCWRGRAKSIWVDVRVLGRVLML